MAPKIVWQPKEEGVTQICGFIEDNLSPDSNPYFLWQRLMQYCQYPEFNNYLAFIFSHALGHEVELRQAAGLLLKNNLKRSYEALDPILDPLCHQYIKSEVLPCLGAAEKNIRSTAVVIISVMFRRGQFGGWPELFRVLIKCLDSNDFNQIEGALGVLLEICQDIAGELETNAPEIAEHLINVLLPKIYQFFGSAHASLRKYSLGVINKFLMLMPAVLYSTADQFLQGLLFLTNDPDSDVRKLVCAVFVELLRGGPTFLEPHLKIIIGYMLQALQDYEKEVALEACGFWSTYCDSHLDPQVLQEFLPHLIPVLLSNMVYPEDCESLTDDEEDGSLRNEDQDVTEIDSYFHSSRFHESDDVDYFDDDKDSDGCSAWDLRKCSAVCLDAIAKVYEDEILHILLPLIQAELSIAVAWNEKEAAVLALGAITVGCGRALYPHLDEIVTSLVPLLNDKSPCIQSISCWTLLRYSKLIIKVVGDQGGRELFKKVLMGLLERILDTNNRVQKAACSALAKLQEGAGEELLPYLETIILHLVWALQRYQKSNLPFVYNAIIMLAEAVGGELNKPSCIDILMHPLNEKWKKVSNSDGEVIWLLECLASINLALEDRSYQFAELLSERCITIIQSQQKAKDKMIKNVLAWDVLMSASLFGVDSVSTGLWYNEEFIIFCLDLLSKLIDDVGSEAERLVSETNLRDLLLQCCGDDALDVRKSAFALLGGLARVSTSYLHPKLYEFLNFAAKELGTSDLSDLSESISAENNACWAIGELAIKIGQQVSPIVPMVLSSLVKIIQYTESSSTDLLKTSAITLGRLAWVCPEIASLHMEHFMQSWCNVLSRIPDDVEKEEAFHGLCAIVRANPSGALSSLVNMCRAIASWEVMDNVDLYNEVCQVLRYFKQMLQNGVWEQCLLSLEPSIRQKLATYQI